MNEDIIILIFEALIYGFCFTTLIIYSLDLFKFKKLKANSIIFIYESIRVIRIVALLYFIYLTYYFVRFYDYSLVVNRATGPYAWAYWLMLLRPIIIILLIQFLWSKHFNKKGLRNFLLVLILLIILFFNGANFERFVIIITSIHRDYDSPSFYQVDSFWYNMPLLVLALFIERILIYTLLVLTSLFISKRITKVKNE